MANVFARENKYILCLYGFFFFFLLAIVKYHKGVRWSWFVPVSWRDSTHWIDKSRVIYIPGLYFSTSAVEKKNL